MVVAKVKGVVSHSSGEDVWKGADLPAEDATEGGKAPKPEEPRTFGVNPVEQEQKAEDLGPKDPPAENAWVDDTLGDEEPEGETAPPDRKRAAMPGIVSRPSGEDVWKGRTVKDEGATEGGTPLKPDEPLDHDLQVGLEEKAESFGPTDPPDDNTWIKDSDADDEPEGSIAPPVRRHAAMTGVAGPLFEAPTITDPIGGPVLCLGPPGLEPASAPELPLAHPKVPSPPECPGITQISKLVTPDASTHHVSLPHSHPKIFVFLVHRLIVGSEGLESTDDLSDCRPHHRLRRRGEGPPGWWNSRPWHSAGPQID